MESKDILVTGGAGFIGTNLVKELENRGHEVFSVDLLHHNYDNYQRCDVRNGNLNEFLKIINLIMYIIWLLNMAVGTGKNTMKIYGRLM